MPSQSIIEKVTVNASPAGAQIELPRLPNASSIYFLFAASRSGEFQLSQDQSGTRFVTIPATSVNPGVFKTGPWSAGDKFYLFSAAPNSVDVEIVVSSYSESEGGFYHDSTGAAGGGGGGGAGDASAANQLTQIGLETSIRDRLPSALVSGRLSVDGSGVTQPVSVANGADQALGATTSPESASGDAPLIGLTKNLRTRIGDLQAIATSIFGGLGAPTDAEAVSGNGSAVAILKNLRSRLGDIIDVRVVPSSAPVKIVNDPDDPQVVASNVRESFREGFASLPLDPARWTIVSSGPVLALEGGNAAGASYVSIVHSALAPSSFDIFTVENFKIPVRCAEMVSLANRQLGHELVLALAGVNSMGDLDLDATPTPLAISGNITVATNVWTVNTSVPHGLVVGDRVILYNCLDSRLNVGPVQIATTPTLSQFTFTSTLANGTYTATGGQVLRVAADGGAKRSVGWLVDGLTATNLRFFTRDGAERPFLSANTASGVTNWSTAVIPNVGVNFAASYADALQPAATLDRILTSSECHWMVTPTDSATPATLLKRTQALPGKDQLFKLRALSRTLDNMSRPVGRIQSIAKSGTTTATVTFDAPHGLTTSDFVVLMGVRDQTNFPNLATATAVASVPNATQITIVIGTASTTSSFGGFVARVNGGQLPALFATGAVQTIQANADGNLVVVGNVSWPAAALLGEIITLYGLRDGSTGYPQYEGMYKLLTPTGNATIILKPMENQDISPLVSALTVGGSLIKNQAVRFHGARVQDYERQVVDIYGAVNKQDNASALPVAIMSSATNSINLVTPTDGHSVQGGVAADAVLRGNPVRGGLVARTADQAVVSANNDVQNMVGDMTGYLLITKQIPTLTFAASSAEINSTTPVPVLAAPGAGVRTVVKGVQVANTGATATIVELLDNTTVISTIAVPGNSTVSFDMSEHVMAQNTALQARLRSGSSGTVIVSASVYRRTI